MTNELTQQDEWRAARAAREIEDARRKAAERKEREAMIAEYPYLTPVADESYENPAWREAWKTNKRTLTKNIKAKLKHDFPAMKFNVHRNNFSMGFDYSVEYTPNVASDEERIELRQRVKKSIACFTRDAEFGIDDSFESHDTPFTRTFGGMPYTAHVYDY